MWLCCEHDHEGGIRAEQPDYGDFHKELTPRAYALMKTKLERKAVLDAEIANSEGIESFSKLIQFLDENSNLTIAALRDLEIEVRKLKGETS